MTTEVINLRIAGQLVGMKQIRQQFRQIKKEAAQLKHVTKGVQKNFGDISKSVKKKEIAESLKRARIEAQRFKAEYLSIMFAGMALQRFFGGFVSAAFQTFNTITEGTDMANNSINRLKAAWEFFKFSLIEALMSSQFFNDMINKVTQLVDWFGQLSPLTRRWIIGLVIGAAALGAALFFLGQFYLGWQGVLMVFGPIVSNMVRLVAATKAWTIVTNLLSKAWTAVLVKIKAGLLFLVTNPISLLIMALLAVVGVAFLLKKKFGTWGDAFKAWAAALVLAITAVVQFSLNNIMRMLSVALEGLKQMLRIAASAAEFSGLDGFASKIRGAISMIDALGDKRFDLMTPVAVKLDELGVNPKPVDEGQTITQFNIDNLIVENFDSQGIDNLELERYGL